MSMYTRKLKERKEVGGNNLEFRVERKIEKVKGEVENEIITESEKDIISNIESEDYAYYVGDSKTLVEVVDANPKYIRSALNESKGDNIDNLPTYQ